MRLCKVLVSLNEWFPLKQWYLLQQLKHHMPCLKDSWTFQCEKFYVALQLRTTHPTIHSTEDSMEPDREAKPINPIHIIFSSGKSSNFKRKML